MRTIPLLLIALLLVTVSHAQTLTVEVNAGQHPRFQTPIFFTLPKALPANSAWQLVNPVTRRSTPVQLLDNRQAVFMLPDSLTANASISYQLQPLKKKTAPAVTIDSKDYGLLLSSHHKPVLFYHTRTSLPPVDSLSLFQRSGFIHPLYSPNGRVLTDDFPEGHMHQHALFTAWTSTTFRNSFIDFWNQAKDLGTVEHMEVIKATGGPVMGQLQVKLRHKSKAHGEVLQEIWTINVYPFEHYFLFDLVSEQRNTSTDTLYLNKYHYGGLGFRGSREWNPDDKENFKQRWQLLTSEGKKDSAANHTHVRWVDASGTVNKALVGATVLGFPDNFRYPQAIRVHPTMPYFVYSPVVDGAFSINPGELYRSGYRYYIHDGKVNTNTVNQLLNDLVTPPVVSIR
ncbi:MAG: PmoA family protein [Candidatus Pseudobacter hemicellulosilyticus]|uniref:PmoA family protein n=1 Tax=Candidatus Pseudobacter hemicellulosilyticus TaxID=3121375 RepID=A0AAJ5WTR0_9BACT|nr:MAG: PmoA family protein [Pseudobacter sp.]